MTPGDVVVQAEGMLQPLKTLVLIQHHVERILEEKTNLPYQIISPYYQKKITLR